MSLWTRIKKAFLPAPPEPAPKPDLNLDERTFFIPSKRFAPALSRRCRECGEGTIHPVMMEGRKMPYRNTAALSVPSTVAIPTCNHCGNEWIDEQTAEALDTALTQEKQ